MPEPELMRVTGDLPAFFSPEPGLERRILANNPRLMLVEHRMVQGWAGARHRHPHDQLVYVLSGLLEFVVGEQRFVVRGGDSLVVRGNVDHQASALEPAVLLDVFTPTRDDYLPRSP
jgi:quercetin dioxygenase-like cupin family protein